MQIVGAGWQFVGAVNRKIPRLKSEARRRPYWFLETPRSQHKKPEGAVFDGRLLPLRKSRGDEFGRRHIGS
jgi:hypothetical protein